MISLRIVITGLFLAGLVNVGTSYAMGRDCPPEYHTVDLGIASVNLEVAPNGMRLRAIYGNRFILQEETLSCIPEGARVGDDGLPIPLVGVVDFKTDVLRRPVVRFQVGSEIPGFQDDLASMLVDVMEQGIEVDRLSEASGVDMLRPVGNGDCHTSAVVDDGIKCLLRTPLTDGDAMPVICSNGYCTANLIPIMHGLAMDLEWNTEGSSAAAMAAEVDAVVSEVYVFLSAVLMR